MINEAFLESLFPDSDAIPDQYRLLRPVHQRRYLVAGELRAWHGAVRTVTSPICMRDDSGSLTPLEIGSCPTTGWREAEEALSAAIAAYDNGRGAWPMMTVGERISCMREFVTRMIAKRGEVVNLLMFEVGKSISDSEKEFDRTVEYINSTIDALKQMDNSSSRFVVVEEVIGQIRRTPLGVVLCMGPFNYPLNETFATLIPALIMGNSVILKPPRLGVLLFDPLAEAFQQSFPAGVVNFTYGTGEDVVPKLLESGKVNVLTLIGSSKIASHLIKLHPKTNRLRAILGLDAKNAAIVLPDADIDLAVKECLLGSLSFNGQRCTALKIILVHAKIADEFLPRFVESLKNLKVGMPWENGVQITPLPDRNKPRYLAECIKDATAKGARILNDGGGTCVQSLFYPAVIYPVRDGMKLYREEQFGPVVPIVPFDDLEFALDYVINSEHGQQVSIFGTDSDAIAGLVDPLVNQVCRVNINSQCQRGPDVFPFTGRKDSAEGTLSVTDALRSFSIRSMIATKKSEVNERIIQDIVERHSSKFIHTGYLF